MEELEKGCGNLFICLVGPNLSHKSFADDLILFAKTDKGLALVMKRCLDEFCSVSEQKIIFQKFSLLVFNSINDTYLGVLKDKLGISLVPELGKYLGVP